MDESHRGGAAATPEPQSIDAAWQQFEARLAGYLATMVDPDEADHLLLEVPGPGGEGGCAPYAQVAAFDDGRMLRVELSGNHFLAPQHHLDAPALSALRDLGWQGGDEAEPNHFQERPVTDAAPIARLVVSALRDDFGLPHPQLLGVRAWGPATEHVGVLGLHPSDEVPVDIVDVVAEIQPPTVELAHYPADAEALTELVREEFRSHFGEQPTTDDDGDIVLVNLGQPVFVRVRRDQPAVEICARVVHSVRSRRTTAVELGLLNRDHLLVKWILRDRDVWQSLTFAAGPFAGPHLRQMIGAFMEAMTQTRDDLALRTGGRVA